MATLHVRNVPDDLYELLRERAAANDRSIGAEAVQLLEERLAGAPEDRLRRLLPAMHGRRRRSGPGMFTRFAPDARQAVVRAQEHARELGHHHVGTAHLLAGILDVATKTPFGKSLERLGLTAETTRSALERAHGTSGDPPTGQIPFEPDAKEALALALRECVQLGDPTITPVHLLLGIHDQETGHGAEILRAAEPDGEKIRRCALAMRLPADAGPEFAARRSFRVLDLEGDAAAWERELNAAAGLGYELVEIVDKRAILRRV